jgi:hypothetical protein
MNKTVKSIILLAIISLSSCTTPSNSESNDNKSIVTEESLPEIQKEVVNAERTKHEPAVFCHTCGSAINGSPYDAFGRVYCDIGCYADDPMN